MPHGGAAARWLTVHAWDLESLDAVCVRGLPPLTTSSRSETVLCVELCYDARSKSLSTSSVLVWSCASYNISESLIIMGQKQAGIKWH